MIIDGRALAHTLLNDVRASLVALEAAPIVRAVVVKPSPATLSYLAIKSARASDAGMALEVVTLEDTATTEDVIQAVEASGASSVIVQLPLPSTIDTDAVLARIPRSLDADVLSPETRAEFEEGKSGALLPPVVSAVARILEEGNVSVSGMRAVVVGSGWLVGAPVATWLRQKGADVVTLTRDSESSLFSSELAKADIIVTGAGSPGLIRPEMLKPGVVLIDAGTSESGGAVVGDADPACASVASLFTPVPGGVGPVAVACLFQNAATLALASTPHLNIGTS